MKKLFFTLALLTLTSSVFADMFIKSEVPFSGSFDNFTSTDVTLEGNDIIFPFTNMSVCFEMPLDESNCLYGGFSAMYLFDSSETILLGCAIGVNLDLFASVINKWVLQGEVGYYYNDRLYTWIIKPELNIVLAPNTTNGWFALAGLGLWIEKPTPIVGRNASYEVNATGSFVSFGCGYKF